MDGVSALAAAGGRCNSSWRGQGFWFLQREAADPRHKKDGHLDGFLDGWKYKIAELKPGRIAPTEQHRALV